MNDSDPHHFARQRRQMVFEQLEARGIADGPVRDAMSRIPRHEFVPKELLDQAYADRALPLGPGQTISQPYIVAYMLEALGLRHSDRVLEIGTGSGYETAILAELTAAVYTIEREDSLAQRASNLLTEQGYGNIHFRVGDGFEGWPEKAPFDKIVISAAPASIPRELVRQLSSRGCMILPLGEEVQELVLLEKTTDGLSSKELGSVRFVEMVRSRS